MMRLFSREPEIEPDLSECRSGGERREVPVAAIPWPANTYLLTV